MTAEELFLEGEAEDSPDTEDSGSFQKFSQHRCPDSLALSGLSHSESSHLGKVLPHHMQSSKANDLTFLLGNYKLLDCLIDLYELFTQENALLNQWLGDLGDRSNV